MGEKRVIIVEDDVDFSRSLEVALKINGYNTLTYNHPRDLFESPPRWMQEDACLVVDWHLPEVSGLELYRRLREKFVSLPWIVMSGYPQTRRVVQAMRNGAFDFIEKPFEIGEILAVLQRVFQAMESNKNRRSKQQIIKDRYESLSPREKEVMGLVVLGKLTKQIAADLHISDKTVEVHRSNITRKMRVSSIPELVRSAVALGLVEDC